MDDLSKRGINCGKSQELELGVTAQNMDNAKREFVLGPDKSWFDVFDIHVRELFHFFILNRRFLLLEAILRPT